MESHAADRRTPAADGAIEWYGSQCVLGYYGSGWPGRPCEYDAVMSRHVPLYASHLSSAAGKIQHHKSPWHGQLVISATTRCIRAVFAPCPVPPFVRGRTMAVLRPAQQVPGRTHYVGMVTYGYRTSMRVHGRCLRILVARSSFPFLPGADGLAADA